MMKRRTLKRQANLKNPNRNHLKRADSPLTRRPGRSPWPACVGLLVPLAALGQAAGGKSTTLVNQWLREQSPAWNAWDIGGEFRTRVDSYHNSSPASATGHFQKSGVDNDDTFILTREKLHVGYQHGWLQVYAELRNSNSSGEDRAGRPNEDRLDLQQAYVSLGDLAQFPLQLQAGRMQLLYGDQRVIGPSDWGNVTRSFDAVRLRFQQSPFWADAFLSRVVVREDGKFNQSNEKDHFWGLYGGVKKLLPWQDLEVYFLGRNTDAPNRAKTGSRDIYTVGFRATSPRNSLGNWDYTVEALHQFGNITQAGRQLDQDAWATSVAAGYTWKDIWGSPRLGFEYNFSTGDSDPTTTRTRPLTSCSPPTTANTA